MKTEKSKQSTKEMAGQNFPSVLKRRTFNISIEVRVQSQVKNGIHTYSFMKMAKNRQYLQNLTNYVLSGKFKNVVNFDVHTQEKLIR